MTRIILEENKCPNCGSNYIIGGVVEHERLKDGTIKRYHTAFCGSCKAHLKYY